jgi:hypothetical protein
MALAWDAAAGRYRDAASGRFVTASAFVRSFDALLDGSRTRMAGLAGQLRGGSLSLAAWQEAARLELRSLHVVAGTLAQGGVQHMTPAAYGKIGQLLQVQYGYLQQVAEDVASGKRPLDGRLENSGRLFAGAARDTFTQLQRDQARQRGVQLEQRVLGQAEHCADCEEAAGHWEPLGSLPRIGDSACRQNCHCHLIYKRGTAA